MLRRSIFALLLASVLARWIVTFMGAIIGFLGDRALPSDSRGVRRRRPRAAALRQLPAADGDRPRRGGVRGRHVDPRPLRGGEAAEQHLTARAGGRWFKVAFVLGLVAFALLPGGQELIAPLASIGVGMALVFLMPLIGALYWPRASEQGAFWSMLAGWAVMVPLQLTGATSSLPTSFGPSAWSFFVSVVVFYGVSLSPPSRCPKSGRQCFTATWRRSSPRAWPHGRGRRSPACGCASRRSVADADPGAVLKRRAVPGVAPADYRRPRRREGRLVWRNPIVVGSSASSSWRSS